MFDIRFLVCLGLLTSAGCAAPRPGGPVDYGPLFSVADHPGGWRQMQAAGPLIEHRQAPAARFSALRPLWSRSSEAARSRSLTEVLWPVGMFKNYKEEFDWRFLTGLGHDFDVGDPESRKRTWWLPVLFMGRDAAGEGYMAFFPIGGSIHEFLGRDQIDFVLFPLYLRHAVNDIETRSILWPLISWTAGEDLRAYRFFPFYGESRKRDAWCKRFVLWPLWTSVSYRYPDAPGGGFLLFPLFGHARAGTHVSTTVLPPFFSWRRGEAAVRVHCPWPFIQYASGAGKEQFYIWPLWGSKTMPGTERRFAVWPLMWSISEDRGATQVHRRMLIPFLFYRSRIESASESADAPGAAAAPGDTVVGRYFKFWPLCSYRRDADIMRFRLLDLWPGYDLAPVERNYAPLWSLYSRRGYADAVEDNLLWGLCTYRRNAAGSRRFSLFPLFEYVREPGAADGAGWSVLKGLVGKELNGRRRLLYWIRW